MTSVGESIKSTLVSIYTEHIRSHLPGKIAEYNSVQVRTDRIFGDSVRPNYEQALVSAIEERTEKGNGIVIIGGGYGVSTVRAAEAVGISGSVVTYEGSENHVEYIKETVDMNGVQKIVDIEHAIVGEALQLLDDPGDAEVIGPGDLPECDVLAMDCEGAEKEILNKLVIRPSTVIVETHDHLESTEQNARRQLEEMGYTIVSSELESQEPRVTVLAGAKEI